MVLAPKLPILKDRSTAVLGNMLMILFPCSYLIVRLRDLVLVEWLIGTRRTDCTRGLETPRLKAVPPVTKCISCPEGWVVQL